jgi:hypothetical protein
MSAPIDTRVGQIVDGDNRFMGQSMREHWSRALTCQSDSIMAAVGVRDLSPAHREVQRLIAICTLSPDARVWPLKLTRLIASHGDAAMGYFGAQLVSTSKFMGPGAGAHAAKALCAIAAEVGDDPSDEAVARAVKAWLARTGERFAGFGVPFRDDDERRVTLLRLAQGGPLERGRYWRLHKQVVAAMTPARPNCVITFVAMLLDVGVEPEQCGLMIATAMAHVFLAHAIESSRSRDPRAQNLAPEWVEYHGITPRHTQAPGPSAPPHPALRRHQTPPENER